MITQNRYLYGLLIQLTSVVLNSIGIITSKILLKNIIVENFLYNFSLYSMISSGIIVYILKYRYKIIALKQITVISIINIIAYILFFYCLNILDPTVFTLFGRSFIIFSIIFSFIYLKETCKSKIEITLIVISIIGLVCSSLPHPINNLSKLSATLSGLTLSLIYSALFALVYILIKKINYNKNYCVCILSYVNLLSFIGLASMMHCLAVYSQNTSFIHGLNKATLLFAIASLSPLVGGILFFKGTDYIPYYISSLFRTLNPLIVYLLTLFCMTSNLSYINMLGFFITSITLGLLVYYRNKDNNNGKSF